MRPLIVLLLASGAALAADEACGQGPMPIARQSTAAMPQNLYVRCGKAHPETCGPVPGPPVSMIYRTHHADTVREGDHSVQRAVVPAHPSKEIHAPFQRMVPPGQRQG